MKSDALDGATIDEAIGCLRTAAGEINHSLFILESKLSNSDLMDYKRMVGKIIIAIYSGLADPILESFPDKKAALYDNAS